MMHVYPAIDLKDGRCVRLRQGVATHVVAYGDDPLAMARRWVSAGAAMLHVVDLDGAFDGQPRHAALIQRMAAEAGVPIQVGGGIRRDSDVAAYLDAGVHRVILGTRALEDPDAVAALARQYGDRIAVGIDARDGWVQVRGWVETTATQAVDLARTVESLGVKILIYTDTATDGMLQGPNLIALGRLCDAVKCRVVASGGIASLEDILHLADMKRDTIEGVIVGKALYEGRLDFRAALDALRRNSSHG